MLEKHAEFEQRLLTAAAAADDFDPSAHAERKRCSALSRFDIAREIGRYIWQAESHLTDATGALPEAFRAMAERQIERQLLMERRARSAIAMALIELRQAVFLLDKVGFRVDDIGPDIVVPDDPRNGDKQEPKDLSELLRLARNIVCHVENEMRRLPGGTPNQLLPDVATISWVLHPTADGDVQIVFGPFSFLVNAHVQRWISSAREKCLEYVGQGTHG